MTEQVAVVRGVVLTQELAGGGPRGRSALYTVKADDGKIYHFDYTDIVRETFRTVTNGDRIRFIPDMRHPSGPRATFVILASDFRDLHYRDLAPP